MNSDPAKSLQNERTPLRQGLLRIANVNPQSVLTNSDEVLYCAIGCFICLYVPYAVLGGAEFIKASNGGKGVWWQWLVGLVIAFAVITFDRAIVGRVTANYSNLSVDDENNLVRKPKRGVYIARAGFAVLMAVVITEPIMIARYGREIQQRIAQVANTNVTNVATKGAVPTLTTQLSKLQAQDAAATGAVNALSNQANADNTQGQQLHQQALADGGGRGISGLSGCPKNGECWTLEQESQRAYAAATAAQNQATALQASQAPEATARAAQEKAIESQIKNIQGSGVVAATQDDGFGAQSSAMWYLAVHDFWGIGLFYFSTALLLLALDCAAILLKLTSFNNGYERAEARRSREIERRLASESARGAQTYRLELDMINAANVIVPAILAEETVTFSDQIVAQSVRDRLHAEVARVASETTEAEHSTTKAARRNGHSHNPRRRNWMRSSLALIVTAASGVVALKIANSGGANTGASQATINAGAAFEPAPNSLIARFRADTAPMLGVATTSGPDSAKPTCAEVAQSLHTINQTDLVAAETTLTNPSLSDLTLDERTARMDALNACMANEHAAFDADLKRAQQVASSLNPRVGAQ